MRPFFTLLTSTILVILTACNPLSNQPIQTPPVLSQVPMTTQVVATPALPLSQQQLIQHIQDSTVALVVAVGEQHTYLPFCAGVWVGPNLILSAAHCLEQENKPIVDLVGDQVHYVARQDIRGVGEEPGSVHLGAVVKHDHKHDLILIVTVGESGAVPAHQIAHLSPANIPPLGSTLHTMGQTTGLYWSYSRGYVAAYRLNLPGPFGEPDGPYLQVSIPTWHGNSGGGLFNDNGELVAIVHSVSHEAPQITFNIPAVCIRRFLGAK